jgi:hypothetical protein
LEDHRDFPASYLAHLIVRSLEKIPFLIEDFARYDFPGGDGNQAHDRQGVHALSAAALSNDPKPLTIVERIGDAVDRGYSSILGIEMRDQISDFEQRVRRLAVTG